MRCVIITAYCESPIRECFLRREDDFILAADRGRLLAHEAGISVDLVISDFDSYEGSFEGDNVIRVPAEKDDTDTMLCIKYAIEHDMRDILIIGGIGGRLDHTVANLQSLLYGAKRGASVTLTDGRNRAFALTPATSPVRLAHETGTTLSIFALAPECRGITLRGVKYPLEGAFLTSDFPLGVSNEITADRAYISVGEGDILVIISKE